MRARGWQPDDLVLAESPLISQFYLGRSDFYVQPEGYERYARLDGSIPRFLYTDAVLLKRHDDFEWLVVRPYQGRTLWVIGHDDRLPRLTRQMDSALWQWLQETSGVSPPRAAGGSCASGYRRAKPGVPSPPPLPERGRGGAACCWRRNRVRIGGSTTPVSPAGILGAQ